MNVKPLTLGTDASTGAPILQQVQPGDSLDPATLPYGYETETRRLLRVLLTDLVAAGFPLRPELLTELTKGT